MVKDVRVTGQDIIDAIEKNGLVHNHSGWFDYDNDRKIKSACVMGQAAVNLGVSYRFLWNSQTVGDDLYAAVSEMINLNDNEYSSGRHRSYSDLKKAARRVFKPFKDQVFFIPAQEYNVIRKGE